jgi:hypothetical protein
MHIEHAINQSCTVPGVVDDIRAASTTGIGMTYGIATAL